MSAATLYAIRLQLGYYGISALIVSGNIGNAFLLLMLGRSFKRHRNSCSLYLFFASLANLLVVDTALISTLYGLDHLEPTHASNVLCKFRWYGGHALFMLSRCFMIAACIDRWALCSRHARIRSLCQPHIAYRVSFLNLLISAVLPSQLFVYFGNGTGRCVLSTLHSLAYTTFAFIAIGTLPLFLMILFGLLARRNLNAIRARIGPSDNSSQRIRIHKRDRDLMKMLAGEVLIYCITTVPYPTNLLYTYLTAPLLAYKSPVRVAVESLVSFLVHPLLSFMYCCTQFYVCAMVSRQFRQDFLGLFHRRVVPQDPTRSTLHTNAHKPS